MAPLYPHDELVRWAVQQGGSFHDDVEVVLTPEKGYHLVVRRNATLQPNTQVVTCPIPCTMSILNVIDAEGGFTCRGIKIPPAFVEKQPRENVERFFLMEHYLVGKKSWWAPYIATLPTAEEVRYMQFQTADDIAWIRGTNLESAFEKQTEQWKAHYEQGMEQLKKLNWQNAKSGKLTWDLYRWAATIFTSRSFTSDVLSDTLAYAKATPIGRYNTSQTTNFHKPGFGGEHVDHAQLADLFSKKFAVLIPVLDILNYRPLAQVEWQARCFSVGLEVREFVGSGAEVHNNYGPRDNETLLLGYGFAVPNNQFDHYSVGLRLPKDLSLTEFRTPPPKNGGPPYNTVPLKHQDPELKCYVFKPEHPEAKGPKNSLETALFSLDLLDAISLLRATDREWQAMSTFRKTYFAEGLERGRFEDSRNLLATMSQLLVECTARLTSLQNTFKAGLVPMNLKQIFARTYRESQIDILQNAIFVCRFVLRRAVENEHEFQGDDEQMMCSLAVRYKFDSNQLVRLNTLLLKHKCMSMRNELLSFQSMLHHNHMSQTSATSLRDVIAELGKERRLKQSMEVDLTAHELSKIQISLTLSALVAESIGNNLLQPRYKSWLEQLMQWYPPDDSNWHYVPDRQPTSPAEAPPPLLLDLLDNASDVLRKRTNPIGSAAWLQPTMIAWGWNVMEEEGVDVPMEVLDDEQTMRNPKEMAFLLYVPQLAERSPQQE
jgi:hypothetical protein